MLHTWCPILFGTTLCHTRKSRCSQSFQHSVGRFNLLWSNSQWGVTSNSVNPKRGMVGLLRNKLILNTTPSIYLSKESIMHIHSFSLCHTTLQTIQNVASIKSVHITILGPAAVPSAFRSLLASQPTYPFLSQVRVFSVTLSLCLAVMDWGGGSRSTLDKTTTTLLFFFTQDMMFSSLSHW